jgi:hypothetical protein
MEKSGGRTGNIETGSTQRRSGDLTTLEHAQRISVLCLKK